MKLHPILLAAALLWFGLSATATLAGDDHDHESHADAPDSQAIRDFAAQKIEWWHGHFKKTKTPVRIKILGFNDFHGHISAGTRVAGRPAGGAAVFAAYLKTAQAGIEDRTFIVHAGDAVGASPLSSALLLDEPTIAFIGAVLKGTPTIVTPSGVAASRSPTRPRPSTATCRKSRPAACTPSSC